MRKHIIGLGALARCAGLVWNSQAKAATISFSHTTPSQAVPLTDSFLLNGFDPSLGTLTGVTLELDTNAMAEVDVLNFSNIEGPGPGGPLPFTNATASIPVTATGPGSTTVTDTLTAGPVSGTASLLYPSVNQYPGLPALDSNTDNVLPANFAPYIGVGLIVPVTTSSTSGTYGGSGPQYVGFGGSAVAGAVTTVTYAYDAVPEPASIGLIVAGIPLLAARRRRTA